MAEIDFDCEGGRVRCTFYTGTKLILNTDVGSEKEARRGLSSAPLRTSL